MGKKLAKMANLRTWAKFSQKLSDKFFFNRTKWRLIMTSFCSQNAILIESPEGGQIGQKWAKIRWFYKLCLISQKLFDKFSFNGTKWIFIMTTFSSQSAIVIELPEGGQIGQKFTDFTNFAYFLKNCLMKFFSNCTKWRLIITSFSCQKAILIESPKVGKLGKNRQKFINFTNFANFLKNCEMNFIQIASSEGSSWPLTLAKTLIWLNRPKVGKLG